MKPYTFCPHCAQKLESFQEHPGCNPATGGCGLVHWNNPIPVAATLIAFPSKEYQIKVNKEFYTEMDKGFSILVRKTAREYTGILAVKRKNEPKSGEWCLPGGFVNEREDPVVAAVRETEEESGLVVELLNQRPIIYNIEEKNETVHFYLGRPIGGELRAGDDALEVRIFTLQDMPRLCFSSHHDMVEKWYAGELRIFKES